MGCGASTIGSVPLDTNETAGQPPPTPDPPDRASAASQAHRWRQHDLGNSQQEDDSGLVDGIAIPGDDRARVSGLREAKRLEEVEQAGAATRIAAVQRGKQDRARVSGLREAKRLEEVEQAEAATRIAAVQRGKQVRARVSGLREAKRLEEVEQAGAATRI
eukprot:COSAG02_NODE_5624_length_4175_cov_1.970069_1_plen_160_part_10